jgi:hypothetical protein
MKPFDGVQHVFKEFTDEEVQGKKVCQVCKFNPDRVYIRADNGEKQCEVKRAQFKCVTCNVNVCGVGCLNLLKPHQS